ncbi:MAG: polysaccharide biosynthesis/export family protein [Pseudomonadota bacterium]
MKKILLGLLALMAVMASAPPAPAADAVLEPYRIGPSDILEIVVWREDALTRKDVLVRPDGRLSMPLADDVVAAGQTPMELKEAITKSLERYIASPKVYVMVNNPRSHSFSVLGNVVKPGDFPLLSSTSLLQGISAAGGFNDWAGKDDIVVLRGKGINQKRLPFKYSEVVAGKNPLQNLELEPGDIIIVP